MAARKFELIAKRDKLIKESNAALEAAQGRALTAEETAAQADYDTKIEALSAELALEERKENRLKLLGSTAKREDGQPDVPGSGPQPRVDGVRLRAEDDPRRGFPSPREFLVTAMRNTGLRAKEDVDDDRLRSLAVFDKEDRMSAGEVAFMLPRAYTPRSLLAAVGSDEQGEYADRYGGFLVNPTFLPNMMQVGTDPDPTAGRTQMLPMTSPLVEVPARTDKNHTTSVSGGFTVSRRAETAAAAASRGEMEKVSLRASSLFGLAYATNEILTDSPLSFAALIASGFAQQFPFHMLNEKIRGNGGAEYLGAINSPAAITVAAEGGQGADTILVDNVLKMDARVWGAGAIWIANHDTKYQLRLLHKIVGTDAVHPRLLYEEPVSEATPARLLGKPIFFTENASKLGDVGDIGLYNWSQYLEGIYQPLQSAESVHVRFVNHETAFKFWLRNAGAPWWRTALTPHKSADTLSPFVFLAAR